MSHSPIAVLDVIVT